MTDIVLMIAGQSNGTQMCTVPVMGCNPVGGTYVLRSGAWCAMTSADGAGMIAIANSIKTATGCDVYVYNCCYGGSSVVAAATSPATPTNCWQYPGAPLADCLAQVAAGCKVPQFVIWIQGEQEAQWALGNPTFDMVSNYKASLDLLRCYLLSQWCVTASQCTWMVTPVGKIVSAQTKYVLQSQQIYFNSTLGVVPGAARYDAALLDGTHMNGPSCWVYGYRLARDILAKLGATGFVNGGPGPQITSAWKGGTTVAMATNSTTGIVAYPGTTFLTGFQVYDYYYTHLMPIVGAWVSSGLIFLSLGENPGDGNHIHILYQADNSLDPSWPPFDQDIPLANWGSPLLPCSGVETSN